MHLRIFLFKFLPSSSAPVAATPSTPDEHYADFRRLQNTTRLLQLGMTLSDEAGNLPKDPETGDMCVWQFNVRIARFIDETDYFLHPFLTENGIDVQNHTHYAINPDVFCAGLTLMNTIVNDRIRWVVFGGTCTFGPLVKALRLQPLPERREEFLQHVRVFFPKFYEIRQLMRSCGLSGTLEDVSRVLDVAVGHYPLNEAGAGSLLTLNEAAAGSLQTLHVFLALRKKHFPNGIPEDKANSILSIT